MVVPIAYNIVIKLYAVNGTARLTVLADPAAAFLVGRPQNVNDALKVAMIRWRVPVSVA